MFRLLRFYSIASFISVFITAALLTFFFRQVNIHWINQLAEDSNTALAQTALNSIKPALLRYLDTVENSPPQTPPHRRLPVELSSAIENVMHGTPVVRLKIYDRNGITAFSTKTSQIGVNQSLNPGFATAIGGRIANKLIYRDSFNPFDQATEEDNLIQTYIPVRNGPGTPIQGVFEIYTDVNQMVRKNEHILFIIFLGAELIMAALFTILVLVVRRASQHIDTQQQGIRERMATLELLSNQLLNSDELEKKKIAFELHEGLAQTLSAIKANVESSRQLIGANNQKAKSLESIVPVIQSAIQEVRSIATELRPSSLDELGLIPTIRWFCNEFERRHPGIQIERALATAEENIPLTLKIVIYRIIESTFNNIMQHPHDEWIRLALQIDNAAITLKIGCTLETVQLPDLQLRFAEAQERTILSSGIFSATRDPSGKVTLTSTWSIQETAAP